LNPAQKRIFLRVFLDSVQKVCEHELKQGRKLPASEALATAALQILKEKGFFEKADPFSSSSQGTS
jgi:hypothetical protein